MDFVLQRIDDLQGIIRANIESADYKPQVDRVLKDYAKKANLKGFRQGKVPVNVIRKMYGRAVVLEELNKVISEELETFIKGEQLELITEPLPKAFDPEQLDPSAEADVELEYEVGFSPAIEVSLDFEDRPVKFEVYIDDEILDKEILQIRDQHGEMSNPEEAVEGDTLFGKLIELDESGNPKAEGLERMYPLNPERVEAEEIKAQVAGKKVEDTFDLKLSDLIGEEDQIVQTLETNVKGEPVRTLTDEERERAISATFRFEVRKINHVEKAEMNQQLFDKVFGEGNVVNEEQFKEKLTEDLEKYLENQTKELYRARTMRALLEKHDVELPEDFLKKYLKASNDKITDANLEAEYENYSRSLKWRLIVDFLRKDNADLEITEEDVRSRSRRVIRAQLEKMMPNLDPAQLESYVDYQMNDEKSKNQLYSEELNERLFDHIDTLAPPTTESISASEFLEELKK